LNTTLNSGEEIEMSVNNLTECIHRAAAVSTSTVPGQAPPMGQS